MPVSERYQNMSKKRKLLFWIVVNAVILLALEGIVRVGYYIATQNTYYLTYGKYDRNWGANYRDLLDPFPGYYKFKPNRTFFEAGGGIRTDQTEGLSVRINNHGFRGVDFSDSKPTDTVRVVTLGESSTFGIHARDEHTYPAELGTLLNAHQLCGRRWEVINAGVPWIRSDQIEHLFTAEILRYSPDVITIYAGHNDATGSVNPDASEIEKARIGFNPVRWWDRRVLIFTELTMWPRGKLLILNESVEALKRLIHYYTPSRERMKALYTPPVVDRATVEAEVSHVAQEFTDHVREIVRQAKAAGIQIVLIAQPMKLHTEYASLKERYGLSGITEEDTVPRRFAEQHARLRRKLEQQGFLYDFETSILRTHENTMRLRTLAEEERLPWVDFFPAVDEDPDLLFSSVHPTEEGNKRIARQLYETFVGHELGCATRSDAHMTTGSLQQ
jgi:lysophospholipase L1-like esterase